MGEQDVDWSFSGESIASQKVIAAFYLLQLESVYTGNILDEAGVVVN